MQISSQMANAKIKTPKQTKNCSGLSHRRLSVTVWPGARGGHGRSTSFLLPSLLLEGRTWPPHPPRASAPTFLNGVAYFGSECWGDGWLLYTWKKERRQVSGRRVALQKAQDGSQHVAGLVAKSCHPLRRPLLQEVLLSVRSRGGLAGTTGRRLWSQWARRCQSPGPRAPRHRSCGAWAAGSSTGLCCGTGGVACSPTGRWGLWNGPTPGRVAPRCSSWNQFVY